jgi:hypothetical protein
VVAAHDTDADHSHSQQRDPPFNPDRTSSLVHLRTCYHMAARQGRLSDWAPKHELPHPVTYSVSLLFL